jgi:hypothetical protein
MFGAQGACAAVGFADQEAESLEQVLREIAKRKKALGTVRKPSLTGAREECLRLLHNTEQAAPSWNWAKQ